VGAENLIRTFDLDFHWGMDWLDAHPGPDTPERRSYVLATTRFAELADVLLDEDVAVSQEAVNCILADLVSLQRAIGRGFN